jgi:HEAT repeat protein
MTEEKRKSTLGGILIILTIPVTAALVAFCIYNYRMWLREDQGPTIYKSKTPEEWVELMHHPIAGHRDKARKFLVQYGDDALPHLEELLQEGSDDTARLEAIYAVQEMGTDAASLFPLLRSTLTDQSFPDRDVAAHVLLDVGDVSIETERALIKALNEEPDPIVRAAFARCLGRAAMSSGAVEALSQSLTREVPSSEDPWSSTNERNARDAARDSLQAIADRGEGSLAVAAREALESNAN